ncbi:MAG: tyrosine-type recombinase/integrase, partial [Planctomycetes bacterium]|nr:tyrosine-type recombinase/integrase [Planctomycetota bacterium]
MSVFQQTYAGGHRAKTWRIDFKDHKGIRRRVSGYKDKRASEQLEATIEQLVLCRLNATLPDEKLVRAIESMPRKVRDRLIAFDVIDRNKEHAAKSIEAHLDDYRDVLEAQGASSKHAVGVRNRALKVFNAAGCHTLADVDRDTIQIAADKLRQQDGISAWTHNHRIAACQQFTKWAADAERIARDPLRGLKRLNAKAARVHQRRALTADEARKLLAAAEVGPVLWCVAGPDRAIVYRMALETGLRANEIATLNRSAFDLDGAQPAVTVEAKHAKNKKRETLPLNPSLAIALRVYLANKLPTALAFALPGSNHTAEMIRAD